jgi:choline-sulfatase
MIREGSYKYTFWVHDIDELYDLNSDPEEIRNLASRPEHRATVACLKQKLFDWHRPAELGSSISHA